MNNLKELRKIIPFKWRIQSYSKNIASATCVAYIDARDVMDLLDEVIGPENWQSDYKGIKGNLYAGIGIKLNEEWIWKWDCGTEPYTEKEKGEASDAFKRAAVKWGVGRFLYDLPVQYVKVSEIKKDNNYPYPVDESNNKIKDLSAYLNESKKVINIINKVYQQYSDQMLVHNNIKIKRIIEEVNNCNNLEELRTVREKYEELESSNIFYKKSLAKKYESLSA